MGEIEINEVSTNKIKYCPCIKCGSEKIDFDDCGYSSFNVAWGRCKDCKHEIKFNCGWDISKRAIINYWNQGNDPVILRKKYESEIAEIQKKIDELP